MTEAGAPGASTARTSATAARLQSGNRILSLIHKAERKRVAKRKIIQFLKKKGITESKIIDAYQTYYQREGLYEITFNQRPLGFSIIMDTRGKNAIVSSIQDANNVNLGMKVASRMYEVNGKRVDEMKHKEILKIISACETPFYVVFRESRKKNKKLDKLQQKMTPSHKWVEDKGDHEEEHSDSEESSSEYSSYSSDDDAAHVTQHFKKKKKHHHHKKRKHTQENKGLFKPSEIHSWDDEALDDERNEMFKQLARLMVGAAVTTDANEGLDVQGMTMKRQTTLKKMIATTPNSREPSQRSQSMSFGISDLMQEEDGPEDYDGEIFKYLQDLTGDQEADPYNMRPTTPSMSMVMTDLWSREELGITEEEIEMRLPENVFKSRTSQDAPSVSGQEESRSEVSATSKTEDEKKDDLLETMKEGTTLMKYGRYGRPKYRMFQLTKDHHFLIWYSPKKDAEDTRIPIEKILRIDIGKESQVVKKTKNEEIHETSFTVYYGEDLKTCQQLTVTAKNQKEAYVWAQGLKILSDAAKKGTNLSNLTSLDVKDKEDVPNRHERTQSVIISMDHVRSQSVLNMFSKESGTTIKSLIKRQKALKDNLQKCVDFVFTKKNYKVIKKKGEVDKVKQALENVDLRLRNVRKALESEDTDKDISAIKADLFQINADLDALKQKLTALVRQQRRL